MDARPMASEIKKYLMWSKINQLKLLLSYKCTTVIVQYPTFGCIFPCSQTHVRFSMICSGMYDFSSGMSGYGIPLADKFIQHAGCPLTDSGSSLTINSIPNTDNRIQIIKSSFTFDLTISFGLNCSNFSNSCALCLIPPSGVRRDALSP